MTAVLAPPPALPREQPSPSLGPRRAVGLVVLLAALVVATAASLAFGANPLPFGAVWDGLLAQDDTEASLIVWDLRIPRTVAGIVVGAAFGVAGALVQALTRNPLADPGILGVNAGADLQDAMAVGFWGAGSIARVTWTSMVPVLVGFAVVVAAAAALAPSLRRLELGDDAAVTQGTRVGLVRLALIVVGVATTALVTAAAGPLGFIALVAPQLARRLTRSPGVSLLAAAAMGATLLVSAHLLSLVVASAYRPVPVGLITVCVGGLYLIWLLVREARRQAVTS